MKRSEKIARLQQIIDAEKDKNMEEEVDTKVTIDGEEVPIFQEGWYNSDTDEIVFDKISDPSVRKAIEEITTRYKTREDEAKVTEEIMKELEGYTLAVDADKIIRLLDRSDITVDADGVKGVKDAIEEVAEDYPTLLAVKDQNDPSSQGFNPANRNKVVKVKDLQFK